MPSLRVRNSIVPPMLSESLTTNLVVAVLAVNSYSLEKAWALRSALSDEGLTNPANSSKLDQRALTVRLAKAGYDRGMLTGMMASRVADLMRAIATGQLDALDEHIRQQDWEAVERLLRAVRGIGPKVAKNALLLLGSSTASR